MWVTRKRVAIGGGIVGALMLVMGIGFGPMVRARVSTEASRRGLDVTVGSVRPGWFAVRLLDVRAHPVGVEVLSIRIDEVRVGWTGSLSVDRIDLHGGEALLRGEPDEIRRELAAWRSRAGGAVDSAGKNGLFTPIECEGFAIAWTLDAEREISASGASASRDANGVRFSADLAHVKERDFDLSFAGASLELDPSQVLRSAHARAVEIAWAAKSGSADELAAASSAPTPTPSASNAPLPPSLLVKTTRIAKRGDSVRRPSNNPPAEGYGPLVPLPDLRGLRAIASATAARIAERIPDGVTISVDALSAKGSRDGVAISFGPGPMTVAHRGDRIELLFSSPGGSGGTPLSLHATLPIGSGDVALTLEGGPVAFSVLGIKDGVAGLTDVEHATLGGKGRLGLADDALTFDGALQVRGAAIRQPRLAADVVRGLDVAVAARGVLGDKGDLRLDDFTATIGSLHVSASGNLKQADDYVTAAMRFDVPSAACQGLLESMPTALLPTLRGAKYSGTFGARGNFSFDTRSLDDLVLTYDIQDQCRVVEAPPVMARERFKNPFTHRIYLPDGSLSEETTGPGTAKWVGLGGISPFMLVAVQTTEDGGFFRHHGFSHPAIRSSIIANLKARRFVRGASTISMQLAKNLFLLREKTLSRKLEEVILTDYLEQVFTKDELMELYLNIIEYGPNIYGIGPSSYHYFGRSASELNLAECLFLSSMLPAPLRYHHLMSSGQLSDSWQHTIEHLMVIAKKSGLISEEELEEGKGETVVFGRTGPRGAARRHSHLDAPPDSETAVVEENN